MRKPDKKKARRKAKQKAGRMRAERSRLREKADYQYFMATEHWGMGRLEDACRSLQDAIRLDPANPEYLMEMGHLAYEARRPDLGSKALWQLYELGKLPPGQIPLLADFLSNSGQYERSLEVLQKFLPQLPRLKLPNKRQLRKGIEQCKTYCEIMLLRESAKSTVSPGKHLAPEEKGPIHDQSRETHEAGSVPAEAIDATSLPGIPITYEVDLAALEKVLSAGATHSHQDYELAVQGYGILFREAFESLICLNSLKGVQSFWYQEETARKVLKAFRGRALLADEVGLGKTIEALMVLKEYIQRGMVRTALILTPPALVSQWRDELKAKFDLDFAMADGQGYRKAEDVLWNEPLVLASIHQAKSKKNFAEVAEREWDIVIVDEAHHLKNRNTLNWKLVNALKKRFLLLLTATPVENNLMELYNLVTLLKPGQLKTSAQFKKEFMTRGDPTDPRNSSRLKELLGEVMIRNTRALARIDIPPRYAETVRVEPLRLELELYERTSHLVREINSTDGSGQRLLLKNLLEEAGSSPRALSKTLSRVLEKRDMLLAHENEIRAIQNICRSLDESSKNRFLLKMIRSSPGKIILFVKYLGTLQHISEFLAWEGIPHALFHGDLDAKAKDEQIDLFREKVDLLVTTEVGGEGRNLQFCHQMVNYDLPWNPMKIEQRIGRIHRIGQEREVFIYNLCAAGSIEDHILRILDKKINMFEMVIGEIDMVLGRVAGEDDFSETIFDIWVSARTETERGKAFDQLAARLKRAKTGYQKTKELDEKLFGESYEL
ncbi:MAG: SNF2-related protein [Thermodesulfobacteriota bacterium]